MDGKSCFSLMTLYTHSHPMCLLFVSLNGRKGREDDDRMRAHHYVAGEQQRQHAAVSSIDSNTIEYNKELSFILLYVSQ